jgi:hypothetical protein
MKDQSKKTLSRRDMLKLVGAGSMGALLAACGTPATETTEATE